MLRSVNELLGYRVHTNDGLFGRIHDLYFDDLSWRLRYLVVDTSTLFARGAKVLLSPHLLGTPGLRTRLLWVSLSSEQLCRSAPAHTDRPVSFREEDKLRYRCFLVPCCEPVMGLPFQTAPWAVEDKAKETGQKDKGDPHLRSFAVVSQYRVLATDGRVGYACDFVMDDKEWALQHVVIEMGHWPRKFKLYCPVSKITSIIWRKSAIQLSCSQQALVPDTDPRHRKTPDNKIDSRIVTLS